MNAQVLFLGRTDGRNAVPSFKQFDYHYSVLRTRHSIFVGHWCVVQCRSSKLLHRRKSATFVCLAVDLIAYSPCSFCAEYFPPTLVLHLELMFYSIESLFLPSFPSLTISFNTWIETCRRPRLGRLPSIYPIKYTAEVKVSNSLCAF